MNTYDIFIILLLIILLVIIYGLYLIINMYKKENDKKQGCKIDKTYDITCDTMSDNKCDNKCEDMCDMDKGKDNEIIEIIENTNGEDRLHERTEAPGFVSDNRTYDEHVIRPERIIPINIRTRGYPTEYQQIGILINIIDKDDIKPLYGRQTYRGSNQWNYYTSTDTDLAIKIPISLKGKKCTDEHGCQEIYENENIDINGKQYKMEKYSNDEFRYIPFVI